MFETGMSALVLKICGEYAQSLGLNFPPCTQQEINAIAEWVNKHTVKDLQITQDGNTLTFTFNQDKETTFTVELPEQYELTVDDLEKFIKGSATVVVDRSEDNKTLVVSLDKSQQVQYITISNTSTPLTAEQRAILAANDNNYIMYNYDIYKRTTKIVNVYQYFGGYDGSVRVKTIYYNGGNGEITYYDEYLQDSIWYLTISPASATQGTLTSDQLKRLKKDMSNSIILNNEIYRLADNQHTTGVMSYVHTGWDGTSVQNKSINITVSTGAWALVQGSSSGGKMYKHDYTITGSGSGNKVYCTVYKSTNTPMTISEVINFFSSAATSGRVVLVGVVTNYTTAGAGYFQNISSPTSYDVYINGTDANFTISTSSEMTQNITEL